MKLPVLKFGKDAVGEFLLNHIEKLVVAVIGLLSLLLMWNGVSALRLKSVAADRRPEALVRLTNETMQHIDAEPNPPAEALRRVGELAKVIEPWRAPQVAVANPSALAPLSRPVVSAATVRGEPRVFPLEDLRAVAGVAVVKDQIAEQATVAAALPPVPDPSGKQGSPTSGNSEYDEPAKRFEKLVPCVVLVGLIPVAKQRAEFRQVLASQAEDPALVQQVDVPRWGDFIVERKTAKKSKDWQPIRPRLVAEQGGSKPLPERFVLRPEDFARQGGESNCVAGLPPRLYQPWGLDTIHPWFLQPRHKWRLERAEQIAETPVQLTPREFCEQFIDHAGHEVELVGMKFTGVSQRTGSQDAIIMGVDAADGSETFPPPAPAAGTATAKTLEPIFVMATAFQKMLDMKDAAACNLRVIPAIDGGAAVAQIVGVTPLKPDGTPKVEQRDPRAGPPGGVNAGFAPGVEGAMPPSMIAGGELVEGAEYRLFRFVDDTVEFGEEYQYRVKLELSNPNWGLDPKLLANPESAETEPFLTTSTTSATVLIPAPYTLAVRDAADIGASAGGSVDNANSESGKRAGTKLTQLGPTQVEVSFLGPTWQRVRGKRSDQGYDFFDQVIERVAPVEPGGAVLWKRQRKAKDKTKGDSKTNKAEKPRAPDPNWRLLSAADMDRDLLDFRGHQASEGSRKDSAAKLDAIQEPMELAFVRSDGSLEVVTAADSQQLLDAFEGSTGGMPSPMGPDMSMPGREGPLRTGSPVP